MRASARLALVVAVIFVLGVVGCRPKKKSPEVESIPRVPKVVTTTLVAEAWTETIRSYGVVQAAGEVTITTDFAGSVESVGFEEGATVEAGQELLRFDASKRELMVKQARTTLKEARTHLDQARRSLRRSERLFEGRAIAREQLESARASLQAAKARYDQTAAAKRLAQHGVAETTVKSPVAGVVARRAVEPGETVMPGQALGVIHVVETVRVLTHVTEREINSLKVGTVCTVTTPGVRGARYEARIESLGAASDTATGNFPVRLTVQNTDGLLRPGMTARVELSGLSREDVILIPTDALTDRNRRRVVFTVVDGRAVEVEPVLAASLRERLPVIEGLEPGDELVIGGLAGVVDGAAVEVLVPPEPSPEAAPAAPKSAPAAPKPAPKAAPEAAPASAGGGE